MIFTLSIGPDYELLKLCIVDLLSIYMNYFEKLFKLPNYIRKQIRKLENIKTKIRKSKWSLVFNDTCLKENILPNYTRTNYYVDFNLFRKQFIISLYKKNKLT